MKRTAILTLVALTLGACNSQDARELTQDAGKLGKTAARAAGNAQLVARINGALAQRKGVDMSGLRVEATGGVVTVGGHVRNAKEKRTVLDTVEGIRGVDRVVDKLRIQAK